MMYSNDLIFNSITSWKYLPPITVTLKSIGISTPTYTSGRGTESARDKVFYISSFKLTLLFKLVATICLFDYFFCNARDWTYGHMHRQLFYPWAICLARLATY